MVHPDIKIIDLYKMFNNLFWFLITNSKKARHARHVRHVSHCKMHVFKETFFTWKYIKSIIVMYCCASEKCLQNNCNHVILDCGQSLRQTNKF